MKILNRLRESLLTPEQLEERRSALAVFKGGGTLAKTIAVGTAALGILNLHDGSYGKALFLFALSYPSYELSVLADNCKEILQNPFKELKAGCAKIKSDAEFWRYITPGAPAAREIGLLFINQEPVQPRQERPFFAKLIQRLSNP